MISFITFQKQRFLNPNACVYTDLHMSFKRLWCSFRVLQVPSWTKELKLKYELLNYVGKIKKQGKLFNIFIKCCKRSYCKHLQLVQTDFQKYKNRETTGVVGIFVCSQYVWAIRQYLLFNIPVRIRSLWVMLQINEQDFLWQYWILNQCEVPLCI